MHGLTHALVPKRRGVNALSTKRLLQLSDKHSQARAAGPSGTARSPFAAQAGTKPLPGTSDATAEH